MAEFHTEISWLLVGTSLGYNLATISIPYSIASPPAWSSQSPPSAPGSWDKKCVRNENVWYQMPESPPINLLFSNKSFLVIRKKSYIDLFIWLISQITSYYYHLSWGTVFSLLSTYRLKGRTSWSCSSRWAGCCGSCWPRWGGDVKPVRGGRDEVEPKDCLAERETQTE